MANKDFEVHPCSHCLPSNKAGTGIDSDNAVDAGCLDVRPRFVCSFVAYPARSILPNNKIRQVSVCLSFTRAMNICVSVWVLASGGEDGRFDLFDEFSRLWYACRRDIKDSGCVDNLTIGWVLQKFRRISTTRSLCINKQDST